MQQIATIIKITVKIENEDGKLGNTRKINFKKISYHGN